jgi:hypothetical protein
MQLSCCLPVVQEKLLWLKPNRYSSGGVMPRLAHQSSMSCLDRCGGSTIGNRTGHLLQPGAAGWALLEDLRARRQAAVSEEPLVPVHLERGTPVRHDRGRHCDVDGAVAHEPPQVGVFHLRVGDQQHQVVGAVFSDDARVAAQLPMPPEY